MKKLKPVKKPKRLDPSTVARLRREKRCFEPDHDRKIEDLSGGLEDKVKLTATLEEALSNLKAEKLQMITHGEAEEMVSSACLKSFREGEKETTESLKKEKHCFDPFHNFFSDKTIANLSLNQVLRLYVHLAKAGMEIKITAFVPKGFEPGGPGSSQLETNKLIDDAIAAVFRKRPFIT